jgi:hypothetical protein
VGDAGKGPPAACSAGRTAGAAPARLAVGGRPGLGLRLWLWIQLQSRIFRVGGLPGVGLGLGLGMGMVAVTVGEGPSQRECSRPDIEKLLTVS